MKKNILKIIISVGVAMLSYLNANAQLYIPSAAGSTTNTSTGNVGIGIATPIYRLDVLGDIRSNGELALAKTSSLYSVIRFNNYWDNVAGNGKLASAGWGGMFQFLNQTGELMYVGMPSGTAGQVISSYTYPFAIHTQQGAVTIGTNVLPTCTTGVALKLFVDGKIGAKEVIVSTTNWCDYVFDKGYKLKSLKEVENFIQANKHLPEVPSEKEVVENGVAMGEMMKIHMKKIEELTLYMIELQKQNEKLATEIANLRK